MKVQNNPSAGSSSVMESEMEDFKSDSESFADLENFGSFMVSENFNDDLRIKECKTPLRNDKEDIK
jgi:hypothetical protein